MVEELPFSDRGAQPRTNLELKARLHDLSTARRAAASLGAQFVRILLQRDTYFTALHGRLKLREVVGEQAELIWYQRPDATGTRTSAYVIVPAAEPELLRTALLHACGVRAQVVKRRELWLYETARIHLDDVERLGTFLEFEDVLSADNDERTARKRVDRLAIALGVAAAERVAGSYVDLLEALA